MDILLFKIAWQIYWLEIKHSVKNMTWQKIVGNVLIIIFLYKVLNIHAGDALIEKNGSHLLVTAAAFSIYRVFVYGKMLTVVDHIPLLHVSRLMIPIALNIPLKIILIDFLLTLLKMCQYFVLFFIITSNSVWGFFEDVLSTVLHVGTINASIQICHILKVYSSENKVKARYWKGCFVAALVALLLLAFAVFVLPVEDYWRKVCFYVACAIEIGLMLSNFWYAKSIIGGSNFSTFYLDKDFYLKDFSKMKKENEAKGVFGYIYTKFVKIFGNKTYVFCSSKEIAQICMELGPLGTAFFFSLLTLFVLFLVKINNEESSIFYLTASAFFCTDSSVNMIAREKRQMVVKIIEDLFSSVSMG